MEFTSVADNRFQDVITTESELRRIIGSPNRWMTSKILSRIDQKCRRFIANSPFVVVGSVGASGLIDVSPKGDPPGFVQVLDDSTLVLPDRAGNRRVDTLRNVLANPQVGLIFLVPGRRETLRVFGRAAIVRDEEVRKAVAGGDRTPEIALVVMVQRAFFHCGKCITRSKLWDFTNGAVDTASSFEAIGF
jgi:PPOX class probable FMN-dependent enzyme